jgi:cytochrome c
MGMKTALGVAVTALVLGSGSAQAAAVDMKAGFELAQKSGCMACHAEDKKLVGPSYKEVAAKYKNEKGAEAKLIEKVKKGGSGTWGPVPMPPNSPRIKDDDIKTLVRWVMAH